MTPSKTQNIQPFPIDEDLHPYKHDPILFVGSPRFSHLRYELRRLLSALTLLQAWSSFPGQPWPTNPVRDGQKGAEPRSATPTGGHRGPAPSLFFGLISPPCTLIPQATRALSHSHSTPLALPTLFLPPRGTRGHPRGQACRASWIFWRQKEYFCRICRRCSSSSRCRMRRKLCSSGMLKASHCSTKG